VAPGVVWATPINELFDWLGHAKRIQKDMKRLADKTPPSN